MKNPKTSNPLVPPTIKDSKHLQQTQNPYTPHPNLQTQLESLILITNPNLQSFHIHILITNPNLPKITIGISQALSLRAD